MLSIVSPKSYNDNQWHQVTATFGASGMQLYVDGVRVATRGEITEGQQYLGYWRVGGDNLNNWPSKPSKNDFTGNVDEVAIYPTVLSPAADRRPVAGQRPHVAAPGAAGRRLRRRRVRRPAGPLLAPRRGERHRRPTDSSASLSPGTYRGMRLHARADRCDHRHDQHGGAVDRVERSSSRRTPATRRPQIYSIEIWFKSTSTQGGKLIGFGNSQTGNSATTDRHVYMQNDGKLVFGILSGAPAQDHDGHGLQRRPVAPCRRHAVGRRHRACTSTASRSAPTRRRRRRPTPATGGSPATRRGARRAASSTARIDEAAVYPTALSAARVAEHFTLGGGVNTNQPPIGGVHVVERSSWRQLRRASDAEVELRLELR